MKKSINKLLSYFNLRLSRVPNSSNDGGKSNAQVIADATDKYGWLKKFNISKVVDIGANDGYFANESSLVFTETPYFCFEPIPSVFNNLQMNFKKRTHFKLYNFGLGNKDESSVINLNEYSPSSSILEMEDLHKEVFDFTRNSIKQEILIKRLDSFLNEIKPDDNTFVKIDVQGYEIQVLLGGSLFIQRSKIVVIEMSFEKLYKEQPLFHEVYTELNRLGFDYHGNIDQLYNPVTHEILQADCLFVNRNM